MNGNTNVQNCPPGQRWDVWKGQCINISPLADGLQGGQPTTPTPPTGLPPTTPPTGLPPTQQPASPLASQLAGQPPTGQPPPPTGQPPPPGRQPPPGGPPPPGPPQAGINPLTGQPLPPGQDPNTEAPTGPSGSKRSWLTPECGTPLTGGDEVCCPEHQYWDNTPVIGQKCRDRSHGILGYCEEASGTHWEGDFIGGKCVPDEEEDPIDEENRLECIGRVGSGWSWDDNLKECVYEEEEEEWNEQDKAAQEQCIAAGHAGWDREKRECIIKQCPRGTRYDEVTNQCVTMCQEGYYWDEIRAQCVPGEDPYGGQEYPECPPGQHYDAYRQICVSSADVIPDESVVPETGDWAGLQGTLPQLAELLSNEGFQEAEDARWNAQIRRVEEEYDKSREELEEKLNVRGLYYSGARHDQLRELEEQRMTDVQGMAAQFQYESYQRELQQKELAINYALGARSLDIKQAMNDGTLTLDHLRLSLEEKLGMSAMDIQRRGIDQQILQYQLEVAMAEAQTKIQRETIWANVITMLYDMGLTEEEVQAMWAKIAGEGSDNPFA